MSLVDLGSQTHHFVDCHYFACQQLIFALKLSKLEVKLLLVGVRRSSVILLPLEICYLALELLPGILEG